MNSIKEIFISGYGPSSSHTIGPTKAAKYILEKYPEAKQINLTVYGSLALTGKGHLLDVCVDKVLKDVPHNIYFDHKKEKEHPNTMIFTTIGKDDHIYEDTILSIGGGSISINGEDEPSNDTYPLSHLTDIVNYCNSNTLSLFEYILHYEDKDIIEYLSDVYDVMEHSRIRGINAEGFLPGPLKVNRKAKDMYLSTKMSRKNKHDITLNVATAAIAVAEENASGGYVCTGPTCGSAGVIPGCITYLRLKSYSKDDIVKGLAVAGLIGIIAKTNGSVSGAVAGCQAEIGVACAMGAAMIAYVTGQDNNHISQASEIAMEHSLGLTCDPVEGYVQIPCIERCAVFALKAVNAATLAIIIPGNKAKVSFDQSVATMLATGKDMNEGYKETSLKGLGNFIKK